MKAASLIQLSVLLISLGMFAVAAESRRAGSAVSSGDAAGVRSRVANVSRAEGLAAWNKIHAVVSHPRCASCHVDDKAVPMWIGDYYGGTRPHGMNIQGGESRSGEETLPCATCHRTSTKPNLVPRAAPHAGIDWMLAPAQFVWFGKTSSEICQQMRDPKRNGGRDGAGLVEHIVHDRDVQGFIAWGFDPGGGRESPPGTLQQHLDDMVKWTSAGMPCPKP